MPPCKNDPKRKYKGDEPSPKGLGWCAHGEKEGEVRNGLDGNKWIVKKVSSGSLRWVKDSGTGVNKGSKKIKQTSIVKSELYDYKNFGIYNHKKKETLVGIYNPKEKLLYPWVKYNKFSNTKKIMVIYSYFFLKSPLLLKVPINNPSFE